MRHVINLVIKFITLALVLGILLPNVSSANTGQAITLAVILTIVAYVVGDLYIFSTFGKFGDHNILWRVCRYRFYRL